MDLYELWNSDPNTSRRKQVVTLNSLKTYLSRSISMQSALIFLCRCGIQIYVLSLSSSSSSSSIQCRFALLSVYEMSFMGQSVYRKITRNATIKPLDS